MKFASKPRLYTIVMGAMFIMFAVFLILWFSVYNRYLVLHYHEQMQLFRYDGFYFRSYISQPGGLASYFGSFLTQFYAFPIAGSIIITSVLAAVILLFYQICKFYGDVRRLFFIPFIPAVLLITSFMDIYFDMSAGLGILFFLIGFRCYYVLPQPVRFVAGPILVTAIYFIAGGNALLLLLMILIFELTCTRYMKKEILSTKKRSKYLYILLLSAWSVLLPWLAWRMVYTVSIREAYFALTPAGFASPTIANIALWLSFPLLNITWMLVTTKMNQWNFSSWKILVSNCLLVAFMTSCGALSGYDRRAEILIRMTSDLQDGNYKSVMALGKKYPANNPLACYLTNIALAESGQLPSRMFHYRQTGVAGLFLDQHLFYSTLWYLGEVYYHLGMIPEAEHCAFEALVSNTKEPNVQTVRRLATTNIIRRDSATADKYLRYLDYSLIYRKWAKLQRTNLDMAMSDSSFQVQGAPTPCHSEDFFIDYQKPDQSLLMLLQANPNNRMAFEYLMAYYMLQKDIEQVKWCMDSFFENFDYQGIPVHYEEALVIYPNMVRADSDFFRRYPVSKSTRERFGRFVQTYEAAQGNKSKSEQLEKQFGNTYWYYLNFVNPSTLQKKDEENRY